MAEINNDVSVDDCIDVLEKRSRVMLVEAEEGLGSTAKLLEYAKDYIGQNELYEEWNFRRDGASLISRLLFEEATDINFYVGRAVNPAHQNPDLPINFNIKMNLVSELSECLRKMGKRIKVSYF